MDFQKELNKLKDLVMKRSSQDLDLVNYMEEYINDRKDCDCESCTKALNVVKKIMKEREKELENDILVNNHNTNVFKEYFENK